MPHPSAGLNHRNGSSIPDDRDREAIKRPPGLLYGVDESLPLSLALLNGVQHVGVVAINLIYPLAVFRVAGVPVTEITALLSLGLIVLGVGALLQSWRNSPLGCGFMAPTGFAAAYFGASVLAAKTGGLPLLFGMTVFAGLLEILLSRVLKRLRAFLPTELSGLVLFMIGVAVGIAAVRLLLGAEAGAPRPAEWGVGAATLGVMVALNVWGRGPVRMLCALIGLAAGYGLAFATGVLGDEPVAHLLATPWLMLPRPWMGPWSFDPALSLPFAIVSLASAMKAVGTVAMCQRMNDADWVRPEPCSVSRGVLGEGLVTALSGLAGGVGVNLSTPSVGVAAATGVASRQLAQVVGVFFLFLGFMPKVAALFAIMPRVVMAAGLLFAACFIIVNGLQTMTSRLLDIRRTLVIGLAIVAGLIVDIHPGLAQGLPSGLASLASSSFAVATLTALLLNLLFRIGVKQRHALRIGLADIGGPAISDFLHAHGASWGARPEIVARASFAANQLAEAVAGQGWETGESTLEVSFDEFNLDLQFSYRGLPPCFPDQRPTEREIIESEHGVRLLAGYLLRHSADSIHSGSHGGMAQVRMHFDH